MSITNKKLSVTAIQNPDGLFTAFFDQLPAIVVQGSSIDDVRVKLSKLLKAFAERLNAIDSNFNIQTASV